MTKERRDNNSPIRIIKEWKDKARAEIKNRRYKINHRNNVAMETEMDVEEVKDN
jgi:hypothetical protein